MFNTSKLGELLAKESIMAKGRTSRNIISTVSGAIGGYIGYTTAVAAGSTPLGAVAVGVSVAITWATSSYGSMVVTEEFINKFELNSYLKKYPKEAKEWLGDFDLKASVADVFEFNITPDTVDLKAA